jgi:hypothetical protein
MAFLAPYMLWGVLAAGIPVALHFFYRSRYRTVPWAAMKFLLASIEQTSRRLRFQELLLLCLRVLVLVLLALALSRPSGSSAGRGARGDAVDAVFLIDNSLSMGARAGAAPPGEGGDDYKAALRQLAGPGGALTCFDRARAAALAVLANLPPHSTVQVYSCADRAALLGPRVPSQLDQARPVIEQLAPSALGTDFLPAAVAAAEALVRGPSPNKELYLFSDMQRSGFDAQAAALKSKLEEVHLKASVHFVHCAAAQTKNVALVGITPQTILRTGERADFAVLVRNTGGKPLNNLTVSLEIDGKAKERQTQLLAAIGAGETRAVVLTAYLDRPGRHVLTAAVKPDDLEGDNRFDQVVHVSDRVGVLLVDGAPDPSERRKSASYHLGHALDPSGGLPVALTTPERVAPRDLGGKELCILVNVRLESDRREEGGALTPEFVRALGGFVQEGRSVMIFAGDRVDAEPYNRLLFAQQRLLPYRIEKVLSSPEDRPWTLDRATAAGEPFGRFRQDEGYASIDRMEARRILALGAPKADDRTLLEESRVLIRYNDGRPAIASRRRPGQGEVMLFTTSVNDPAWSDWYVARAFVPFVQVALHHLLDGRPQAFNRTAGEPILWQAPVSESENAYDLLTPDGGRVRLGYPTVTAGRALLTAPDVTRAGLYRIVPAGRDAADESPLFAVTPNPNETEDLQTLAPAQIDGRIGFAGVHVTAADDGAVFSGAERLKQEWTVWLLVGLLVLVLGEMALAWYCGRGW